MTIQMDEPFFLVMLSFFRHFENEFRIFFLFSFELGHFGRKGQGAV